MSISVALINPKFPHNVGATLRAMSCFNESGKLFWTGNRVNPDVMKRIPREERMKDYANINWERVDKPLDMVPDATPIGIELLPGTQSLENFQHPENAIYVFGPEDGSLPKGIRVACHQFVAIPSNHCLNLGSAVNIILYDRLFKQWLKDGTPMPSLAEDRGWAINDFDRSSDS